MTTTSEETVSSPEALLALLPGAVTAIVFLSALGYFIGWREAHAYYTALGVTWATTAVPPLTLLQLSANTIVAIATASFLSLVLLIDDKVSTRTLSWICAVAIGLAGVVLALSQGLFGGLSPSKSYALASVGSTLCAIAAGITLSELIGHVRQSNRKISSGHLWLVYWFVLPGLFWAPDRLGQARALRDSDAAVSALPIVAFESTSTPGEWRLVHLIEGKGLVMLVADNAHKRLFKIVEAKDVKTIHSTILPKATP